MGAEIYHAVKGVLRERGLATGVGDEGGFAPDLRSNSQALDVILVAIQQAGYEPGRDVLLGLDVAASSLLDGGTYRLAAEKRPEKSASDMIRFYEDLLDRYPIASIEDGLGEDDFEGWKELTIALGSRAQLVGDDVFVTDPETVARAIREGMANAVLDQLENASTQEEFNEVFNGLFGGFATPR